jgi:hypothetical protein
MVMKKTVVTVVLLVLVISLASGCGRVNGTDMVVALAKAFDNFMDNLNGIINFLVDILSKFKINGTEVKQDKEANEKLRMVVQSAKAVLEGNPTVEDIERLLDGSMPDTIAADFKKKLQDQVKEKQDQIKELEDAHKNGKIKQKEYEMTLDEYKRELVALNGAVKKAGEFAGEKGKIIAEAKKLGFFEPLKDQLIIPGSTGPKALLKSVRVGISIPDGYQFLGVKSVPDLGSLGISLVRNPDAEREIEAVAPMIKSAAHWEVYDLQASDMTPPIVPLDADGVSFDVESKEGPLLQPPLFALRDNVTGFWVLSDGRTIGPPLLDSIEPSAADHVGTVFTTTITGSDFTGATTVSFNPALAAQGTSITVDSFSVDSPTQITAHIKVPADAQVGLYDVTVTTPIDTGTFPAGFEVTGRCSSVVYQDAFLNPNSGWSVGTDSNGNDRNYTFVNGNGEYQVLVRNPNWVAWSWAPADSTSDTFCLEVSTQQVVNEGLSDDGAMGLIFAGNPGAQTFTSFVVAPKRSMYSVRTHTLQEDTALVDWTASDAIQGINTWNHLLIVAKGGKADFYVNGTLLTTINLNAVGSVGVIAETFDTPNGNAHFSNFMVSAVP